MSGRRAVTGTGARSVAERGSSRLVLALQIRIPAGLHPFRLARHLGGAERFSVVLTSRDAGPSVALCSLLSGEFSPLFTRGHSHANHFKHPAAHDTPTKQLQATARELVDELLRRGFGVGEVCNQLDVSEHELWTW